MEKVTVHETIAFRNGRCYIENSYLQWGEKEESIGSFLLRQPSDLFGYDLLNLAEGEEWTDRKELDDVDEILVQVVRFMEKTHEKSELNGRVNLYYLINFCNMWEGEIERLADAGEVDFSELVPSVRELQREPWICIGWGRNSVWSFPSINTLKSMWMNRIETARIRKFGSKEECNTLDFNEIHPDVADGGSGIFQCLVKQFREGIRNAPHMREYVEFSAGAAAPNINRKRMGIDGEEEDTNFFFSPKPGWTKSINDPEEIVYSFSHLHVNEKFKLRGYHYSDGQNGNGIVWAIPANQVLPSVQECKTLDDNFLRPPKPDFAIDDYMEAIDGDRSPLSYLQAAICLHELDEFGAVWHGVSWGQDRILPYDEEEFFDSGNIEGYLDSLRPGIRLEEIPEHLFPHFFYKNGYPVIVFHTINDIGQITVNRYTHVFRNGDYTQDVTRQEIGYGGSGIIF